MDEEEKVIVGLALSAPDFEDSVVEGSKAGYFCYRCGGELSLAPSGQNYVIQENVTKFLCSNCAIPELREKKKEMDAQGEEMTVKAVPGAEVELKRKLDQYASDKVFRESAKGWWN